MWVCLWIAALLPVRRECATAVGNASTVSKKEEEGEEKKSAGEMLMSCPVRYPYLWSVNISCPSLPCSDARIRDAVGVHFVSCLFSVSQTQQTETCLVSRHAWGVPPPCWCVVFILPSCWSVSILTLFQSHLWPLCKFYTYIQQTRVTHNLYMSLQVYLGYNLESHKFQRHFRDLSHQEGTSYSCLSGLGWRSHKVTWKNPQGGWETNRQGYGCVWKKEAGGGGVCGGWGVLG